MLRNLLIVLATAAVVAVPLWRRRARTAANPSPPRPRRDDQTSAPTNEPRADAVIDAQEAMRRVYELALDSAARTEPTGEHLEVVTATTRALKSAATDQRYLPRRPMLLPRLLRAVSDDTATQREIAAIIAEDPALVGNLLKLANSPLYRRPGQLVESVDRAVTLLGVGGVRSLVTVALVQPLFRGTQSRFVRFVDIIWDHAFRAGAAAQTRAETLGTADPVAAQLVPLVAGLGKVVVFRVALEQYARRPTLVPDANTIMALLDTGAASAAKRIAASWELPATVVDALDEPVAGRPASAADSLRRALLFGRHAAALSLLVRAGSLEEETALASLAAGAAGGARVARLWAHLIG